MRLGVLRNPSSTVNRGRPSPPLPSGALLEETTRARETAAALMRLRRAGAEVIVVDGGDGTVRAAAADLAFAAAGAAAVDLPMAILPHGNTNLIARRLGWLRGAADLRWLAAGTPAGLTPWIRSRPVMRLRFANGRPPLAGFIAGWGAYAAGTRIAAEEVARRHRAQVAWALVTTLRRAVLGAEASALRRGVAVTLGAEGHAAARGPRFLGIVTALPGALTLGLEPFWGEGEGALRWLDIAAPPRRLALAAPLVAVGRPLPWMTRAGYRSGRSRRLELRLEGELVVDGERLSLDAGTVLTFTADDRVSIVARRGGRHPSPTDRHAGGTR